MPNSVSANSRLLPADRTGSPRIRRRSSVVLTYPQPHSAVGVAAVRVIVDRTRLVDATTNIDIDRRWNRGGLVAVDWNHFNPNHLSSLEGIENWRLRDIEHL